MSSSSYNDIVSSTSSNPSESSFSSSSLLAPSSYPSSFYSSTSSSHNGFGGGQTVGSGYGTDQYSNKSGYHHQFYPSNQYAASYQAAMGIGMPAMVGQEDGAMAYGTNVPWSPYNYAFAAATLGPLYGQYGQYVANGNHNGRRGRQTYNKRVTSALEDEFKNNRYLTRRRRVELAQYTLLSERQIKIWFQNRRMKYKKETKNQPKNNSDSDEPPKGTNKEKISSNAATTALPASSTVTSGANSAILSSSTYATSNQMQQINSQFSKLSYSNQCQPSYHYPMSSKLENGAQLTPYGSGAYIFGTGGLHSQEDVKRTWLTAGSNFYGANSHVKDDFKPQHNGDDVKYKIDGSYMGSCFGQFQLPKDDGGKMSLTNQTVKVAPTFQ